VAQRQQKPMLPVDAAVSIFAQARGGLVPGDARECRPIGLY
jgi:hypothetical protein